MDLSLVQMSDMLKEIEKRTDAFIFVAITKTTNDVDGHVVNYNGSRSTCIGLTYMLLHVLINDMKFSKTKNEDYNG